MIESSSFNTVGAAKPKFIVRLFYRKSLLAPMAHKEMINRGMIQTSIPGLYLLEERDRASLYILFLKLEASFYGYL